MRLLHTSRAMMWTLTTTGWLILMLPFVTALHAAQEASHDIDIIALTNLATSKEHVAAYVQSLRSEAEGAYQGLNVKVYENDEKAKEGAARYRLAIEHKGTVTLGNALTVRSGFPKSDIKSFVNGKRLNIVVGTDFKYHQSIWYLPASHKGTLAFKFQEWDGKAYKTLESWTIVAPERDEVLESKGMLPVADLVQDGKKVKIDLKPMCPKTLAEAKEDALMMLTAGEFSRSILSRLAKGTVLKAMGDGSGMVDLEVLVENKSPWPIKKAKADAFVKGTVLVGELTFAPPIPPGKSGKARAMVTPESPDTKRISGVRLSELQFEPAKN
jgi:hypothetical protein